MNFKEIMPEDINDNLFKRLGKDWMLITAGDERKCNTMTASWGQFGIVWGRPVVTVYLRHQRYTMEFVERQEVFSLSFFEPGTHRDALNLLGKVSGRHEDKLAQTDLQVCMLEGVPAFAQANMVLLCRKLYQQDMTSDSFLASSLKTLHHAGDDFHRAYTGEIEHVFVK